MYCRLRHGRELVEHHPGRQIGVDAAGSKPALPRARAGLEVEQVVCEKGARIFFVGDVSRRTYRHHDFRHEGQKRHRSAGPISQTPTTKYVCNGLWQRRVVA